MDLIFIIGAPAAGKMTVGQELSKLIDFKLMHNHIAIEPVYSVFNEFNHWDVVLGIRDLIINKFLITNKGLIMTLMIDFDLASDIIYLYNIADRLIESGGNIYCVELIADLSVRLDRNKTMNRLNHKPSKRDLVQSDRYIIETEGRHRCVSSVGEEPFDNYLRIDNNGMSAYEVALEIVKHFNLEMVEYND